MVVWEHQEDSALAIPVQGLTALITGLVRERSRDAADHPTPSLDGATHRLADGRYGFPSRSLKRALVEAWKYSFGNKRFTDLSTLRASIYVPGEGPKSNLVPISSPGPELFQRFVQVSGETVYSDTYALFWPWQMEVTVRYRSSAVNSQFILDLVKTAGRKGIGFLRTTLGDEDFGQFRIADNPLG